MYMPASDIVRFLQRKILTFLTLCAIISAEHLLKSTEEYGRFDQLCNLYKYGDAELVKVAKRAKKLDFCLK